MKTINLFDMRRDGSKLSRLSLMLLILLVASTNVFSQTTISSLSQLKDRLDDSNGNFKMTPGTYYFNSDNTGPGKLFGDESILLFTGSNNTFDFTGVKFEFDTEALDEFTDWVVEFWPVGNNNVYLNLTMEDIGMNVVGRGGEAIHLDGADNRIEGFHITVRGSFPYGYGDIFGKGGGSVIGHQKHAGILVRGDRNHVKNCTLIMQSYGHGIFMQGSHDAIVEGCYVEGELSTVSAVLAEEGTGSPADNVDFETVWGFNLRDLEHDYRFSLQEDGIRCYTTGNIYGTSESRSTEGTIIRNCTVVKMRSGVTIGWDYSDKIVDNCTVLACGTGFWFGSNTVATNCSGDASVGPLVSEDVERDGSTMEVTLLDNYVPKIGNCPHLFYSGHNHELTLHDGTTNFDSDIVLQIGGARQGHRWIGGLTRAGSNLTFNNNTPYPIVVESNISNSDIISCGSVDDNGSGTSVTIDSNCTQSCGDFDAYATIEAESYCDQSGTQTETTSDTGGGQNVGWINDGDWLRFDDVDFDNGAESVDVRVASSSSGGTVEFRLGSTSGTLLGTAVVPVTGGWQTWTTVSADISGASGTQDLYVLFAQGGININWFEFTAGTNPVGTNIALNGTATQSSTAYSGVASRAIDGITSGNWSDGSVTHTAADTSNPWWEVDLGGTFDIDNIDIYNRTNCCSERLSNFTVSVIDGSTTTFSQTFASYPDPSISIDAGGATGNVVRVQINGTGTLSLAEVEVYGSENTGGPTQNTFTIQENEAGFCSVDGSVDSNNAGFTGTGFANTANATGNGTNWEISGVDGEYTFKWRFASSSSRPGNLIVNGNTLVSNISFPSTGGWTTWATTGSTTVSLPTGTKTVRLEAAGSSGLANIDYIEVTGPDATVSNCGSTARIGASSININSESNQGISVYPNPVSDILNVSLSESNYNQFDIYHIDGRVVQRGLIANEVTNLSIDLGTLESGVYILKLTGIQSDKQMKILKQ